MSTTDATENISNTVKCVVVGDGGVGKTCMLYSYASNKFPTSYVPTVFDNYTVDVLMGERLLQLGLFDTAGQDVYDKIRILTYAGTDVILLCYSVVHPVSYQNVQDSWIEELRRYAPKSCPIVLVGTQIDLREDKETIDNLQKKKHRPLSVEQGENLARRMKVNAYVECSALTQRNLKDVFDTAIVAALNPVKKKEKGSIFKACFSPKR